MQRFRRPPIHPQQDHQNPGACDRGHMARRNWRKSRISIAARCFRRAAVVFAKGEFAKGEAGFAFANGCNSCIALLDGTVDLHRCHGSSPKASSLGAAESRRRGDQAWRFCF
jgi:hypothetical protein